MSDEITDDEWIEVEVPADALVVAMRKAFTLKSEGKRIKLVLILDGRAPLNEGDKLRRIDFEEWKP